MSNISQNEIKPLNLEYVSNIIGDDYKKWRNGDVVCINAQTGTGKTFFITGNAQTTGLIGSLKSNENLIYLCNRIALKRQVKLDLLKKFSIKPPLIVNETGKKSIDFDKLDDITVIKNVTIAAYHAIANGVKEKMFLSLENKCSLENYKYIICDECHFILTDSSYMNKTQLVLYEIVREKYPNSILIYISATIDEILPLIDKAFEDNKVKGWSAEENHLYKYTTGIDYSYLDVKYFYSEKDIISLVNNDKSEDKWLIFVTSKDAGKKLQQEFKDHDIDSAFIMSGTNNEETKSIIDSGQFHCKVLISTKVLDNGVNIKDISVKNLVVCAYDKTTFIQEIGRVRINIKNPRKINLFIKAMNKKIFLGRKKSVYKPKLDDVELFEKDFDKFKLHYNMDLNQVYPDIFYLNEKNEWKINTTGYARLLKDNDFALNIIEAFDSDKFAFIKEQLKWLEKDNEFDKNNFIEDVVESNDLNQLIQFLEKAYNDNERFTKQFFKNSIMEIINNSDTLKVKLNKIDGNHKREKGCKVFNKLFDMCNLPYAVINKRYTTDNMKETKWIVGSVSDH